MPCRLSTRCRIASATVHRVRPGTLGDRQRDRRDADRLAVLPTGHRGHGEVGRVDGEADVGDVANIDRPPVTRRQQQIADVLGRLQRLAGDDFDLPAPVADASGGEGPVRAGDLSGELLQGDAIESQSFGMGAIRIASPVSTDEIGESDVVDLGDLGPQLARDPGQIVRSDPVGRIRTRGQRQRHDGHVVDAAPDDQRLGNPDRDAVEVGTHLVVDPQHRGVGGGATTSGGR